VVIPPEVKNLHAKFGAKSFNQISNIITEKSFSIATDKVHPDDLISPYLRLLEDELQNLVSKASGRHWFPDAAGRGYFPVFYPTGGSVWLRDFRRISASPKDNQCT
jgi:hypothetical protein